MIRATLLGLLISVQACAGIFPFAFWKSSSAPAAAHVFAAVAQSGTNRAMWSDNGTSWTAAAMPEASTWESITWFSGGSIFVAVASDGTNRFAWSSDGATWTAGTNPSTSKSWKSVACSSSKCVALSNSTGTNEAAYSTDGKTWTNTDTASWNGCSTTRCVAWDSGNSLFAATSNGGTGYMSSSDGITWTARTGCAATLGGAVAYSSSIPILAAMGSGATSNPIACSSTTGTSWTARNVNNIGPWQDIVWNPDQGEFVGVTGNGGTENANVSTNGTSYVRSDTGTSKTLKSIAWSSTLSLYAVVTNNTGDATQVYTSATAADTGSWTGRTSGETNQWVSIAASR